MYLLYSMLSALAYFMLTPGLLWPPTRRKYLPGIRERLSLWLPQPTHQGEPCIWVHAVSVGEVLAVRKLIERLISVNPGTRVVLSTITLTGNRLAKKHFPGIPIFFFPLDLGPIIDRYLRILNPSLFISVESEFWPNFYRHLGTRKSRIVIVNGRVTESSFRNYRLARRFFRRVLSEVDLFLMQTKADAARVLDLGARPKKVIVVGNLKYDLTLQPRPSIKQVLHQIGRALNLQPRSPLLVAGSTMPGEETAVLELFRFLRQIHAETKLILAPRHPERFHQVAALLGKSGLRWTRRSQISSDTLLEMAPVDVLLLDTIGELPYLYEPASLVFIGGSLTDHGGHNILEPAYFGRAILFGPHMENFLEIAQEFLRGQAAIQVSDLEELKEVAGRLMVQAPEREQLGHQALQVIQANGGALDRTLDHIVDLMNPIDRPRAAYSHSQP